LTLRATQTVCFSFFFNSCDFVAFQRFLASKCLNPFGSTLLQFVGFGQLPGAWTLSEPQIGIYDFQFYCSQACELSVLLQKIINPLGGSHYAQSQPESIPKPRLCFHLLI